MQRLVLQRRSGSDRLGARAGDYVGNDARVLITGRVIGLRIEEFAARHRDAVEKLALRPIGAGDWNRVHTE